MLTWLCLQDLPDEIRRWYISCPAHQWQRCVEGLEGIKAFCPLAQKGKVIMVYVATYLRMELRFLSFFLSPF